MYDAISPVLAAEPENQYFANGECMCVDVSLSVQVVSMKSTCLIVTGTASNKRNCARSLATLLRKKKSNKETNLDG